MYGNMHAFKDLQEVEHLLISNRKCTYMQGLIDLEEVDHLLISHSTCICMN